MAKKEYEIPEGNTVFKILQGEFEKDSEGSVELILKVQVYNYKTRDDENSWETLKIKIKDWSYIEA